MRHKSCGNCKHFEKQGYNIWGKCNAPVPRWVLEGDEIPNDTVWADGGYHDFAKDCEMYERSDE